MSDTTAELARSISRTMNAIGGRFMLHPETLGEAGPAGYGNPFLLYAAGRGGVLGAVDADVVTAAFGFFEPGLVRSMWGPGIAVEGPQAAASRFTDLCAAWGRKRLAGVEGLERFAELLARAIDAASVGGLPLFAGWRAVPRPDDAAGRAYLLCHVAREWRGSAHVVATVAMGLTPLESMLQDPKVGPGGPKLFGWPEPFPDTSAAAERRARAEELTDELVLAGFSALTDEELRELRDLAATVAAALDAAA